MACENFGKKQFVKIFSKNNREKLDRKKFLVRNKTFWHAQKIWYEQKNS